MYKRHPAGMPGRASQGALQVILQRADVACVMQTARERLSLRRFWTRAILRINDRFS